MAREIVDTYVVVRSDNYDHIENVHVALNHLLTAYFRILIAKEMVVGQADDLGGKALE